ncbi:MAG: polysaccharide biosynthesis C-terminal domain-containing protein, partial [Rhodospirillales bacterium]
MGYFVEKKLYLESRNWLFSLIAYLLLNYLLIPIYDITGAIIALNICFVVYICMSIQNISKYISFKYFCKILISMTIGISLHGMTMFFDFSIFGSIIFTIIEFLIIIIIFKKFVNYDELKSDLKIIFIQQ